MTPMTPFFDYSLSPDDAIGENDVQRALREALHRIRRDGHQVVASSGPILRPILTCGMPYASKAPTPAIEKAADLVLQALAKGCGDELSFVGLDYPDILDSIEIFADAIYLCDASACALLELVHSHAGSPRRPLPEVPVEAPSVRYQI